MTQTEPVGRHGPPLGVTIRRAYDDERATLGDLYLRVRRENAAVIPPVVHPDESVRQWWSTVLPARDEIWVAELAGEVVGVMALRRPDWLDQLYVVGSAAGRGIGAALLAVARRELGARVQLWTFAANTGARRFYERHCFVVVEQTDGDNEEGAPDVRYLSVGGEGDHRTS